MHSMTDTKRLQVDVFGLSDGGEDKRAMFSKEGFMLVVNSIICTYCDVRPQHVTCQKLNNVLTFLLGVDIWKYNPYAGVTFLNTY